MHEHPSIVRHDYHVIPSLCPQPDRHKFEGLGDMKGKNLNIGMTLQSAKNLAKLGGKMFSSATASDGV